MKKSTLMPVSGHLPGCPTCGSGSAIEGFLDEFAAEFRHAAAAGLCRLRQQGVGGEARHRIQLQEPWVLVVEDEVRTPEVATSNRRSDSKGVLVACSHRWTRDLRIEDVDLDTNLGPRDVWVETKISALKIGTDRGNYEGAEQVPGAPDYPRPVGDSSLGSVRGVGSEVGDLKVGERVFSRNWHQSGYILDRDQIAKVPDDVSDEDGVYAGLYSLCALSYTRCQYQSGETVAVVGLGVLGMGEVALGNAYGARVAAIGNSPIRLEMADRMGAHFCALYDDPRLSEKLDEWTGGSGVDLVINTANPWSAYRVSVEIVRSHGRVGILGLPGRGEPPLDFNPLSMEWFYSKSLTVTAVSGQASHFYSPEGRSNLDDSCRHVLSLMASGRVSPSRLITHRLPFDRMKEAYDMIDRREKNMLGVIFQW